MFNHFRLFFHRTSFCLLYNSFKKCTNLINVNECFLIIVIYCKGLSRKYVHYTLGVTFFKISRFFRKFHFFSKFCWFLFTFIIKSPFFFDFVKENDNFFVFYGRRHTWAKGWSTPLPPTNVRKAKKLLFKSAIKIGPT